MSESPASSPSSSPRPFDFAELGRPVPKSVRALPNVPDADASGALEELSADDILESDDIDAFEAAAAGIASFEAAPPSSGFEVGELGSFDDVEVEGLAVRATEPSPAPAPSAVITNIAAAYVPAPAAAPVAEAAPARAAIDAAPVSIKVDYSSPHPTTLVGVPAAPNTSPLPLEESVIVSEPPAERTLEIRGNDMAKVAAAAAKLDAQPEQTEVLVRSAMPAALQRGAVPAAYTPAPPHAQQARPQTQGQPVHGRPSSIAPVALDVTELPRPARMPSVPAIAAPMHIPSRAVAPKRGMSGAVIGGIAFAALALVGLVGVGGYAASRALSDKAETASVSPEATSNEGQLAAAGTTAAPETAPAAEPAAAGSAPIDVSSLPSAPTRGAAPRGFTGSGSFVAPATPTPPPVVAASPVAPAAPAPAPAAAEKRSSGGALPAPGSGSGSKAVTATGPAGAPLPPPQSAPAAAGAPAAPAVVSTTGVVRVDPSLRAVIVDGSYRRANDGVLTVSCGTHRIKAGMKEQQTVHVPCGGSVSL